VQNGSGVDLGVKSTPIQSKKITACISTSNLKSNIAKECVNENPPKPLEIQYDLDELRTNFRKTS